MEAAKPSLTIAPRRSRAVEWLNLRRMDGLLLGAAAGLIAFSVFDGLLDDVAAMCFHRFMVRE